jgi:hypothetical protein
MIIDNKCKETVEPISLSLYKKKRMGSTIMTPTTFATPETPCGFPIPDMPESTERCFGPNCQESDVDECVQEIVNQKDSWTTTFDEDNVQELLSKLSYRQDVLQFAVAECRWRSKQWEERVGLFAKPD